MKVRVYTIGKKRVIGEYQTRMVYDSRFYFRKMPTLSRANCTKILNEISPCMKISESLFVLEDVETGHCGLQTIYRDGTIMNF